MAGSGWVRREGGGEGGWVLREDVGEGGLVAHREEWSESTERLSGGV